MSGLWIAVFFVGFRPDVEVLTYWKFRDVEEVLLKNPPNEGEQPPGPSLEEMLRGKESRWPKTATLLHYRNRDTGELFQWNDTNWVPLKRYRNRDTGEMVEWDGTNWVPVPTATTGGSKWVPIAGVVQSFLYTKRNLWEFAFIAFGPPAILLVIGFVIGVGGAWVSRGFRRGDV